MQKKIHLFLLNLILVLLFSCKSETEKTAERNAIINNTIYNFEKKLVSQEIDSVFSDHEFNGSVAVFQNNQKIYEKENGFENFKTKSRLTRNSVFAIGSLSKQFTAVLILLQEEKGKLKTSDRVSKYLTEFEPKEFENITIKELLNHTSGMNDFGQGLLSKPGEKFNYSNKGYRFLGKIIAKVTGKSYDENAKELFGKAGMKTASTANFFHGNNFASAYTGTFKKHQEIENMPKRLSGEEISVPAGGILATFEDLHQWNNALFGGEILKPESLRKFEENATTRNHPLFGKVGYGFGIMMNLGKPKSFFHTGYVKGSPSLNIYYPESKTSVVILSNIADENSGKEDFFLPHKEIKKIMDAVENTVVELRKD